MERTEVATATPGREKGDDFGAQNGFLGRIFQIAPVPGLIFDSFRLVGTNDAARMLIRQHLLTPELLMKARSAAYATNGGSERLFDGATVRFRTLVAKTLGDTPREDLLRICFLLPGSATENRESTLDRFELSAPQRRVAVLLQTGRKNREIAQDLGLSIETIRKHVAHILTKTGTSTRAAFVALALSPMR